MKRMIKYTGIVAAILISSTVNAQEFKTTESISSQLKGNKVPNAKYSTERPTPRKADTAPLEQNVSKAIKEGRLFGIKSSSGQSQSPANSTKTNNSNSPTLPSELSAEDRQKELEEAKKQGKMVVPHEQVVEKKE